MLKKILIAFLCAAMIIITPMSAAAKSKEEINNEISDLEQKTKELEKQIKVLKDQKADQNAIKKKIQQKVDNTKEQISLCNNKISSYQSEIDKFQSEIDTMNKEMDELILLFKRRIRAIYMSNSNSGILQVLMGAENFSDYLTLSELSKRVSAHDKAMVDDIVDLVEKINEKQGAIQVKIDEQTAAKKLLAEKQKELNAQVAEVNAVIGEINADMDPLEDEKKKYDKAIESLENELKKYINQAQNSSVKYDGSQFAWPCKGYYYISSPYGYRVNPVSGKYKLHSGLDIAGSGIHGAPISAAADGVIITSGYNTGGYGNYVMIDHGLKDGKSYITLYGHMSKIASSSKVGATVKKGQTIGYVGSTGNSTGPHLHFEIIINGSKVNPANYFNIVK